MLAGSRAKRMKLKDTTLYAVGTVFVAMAAIAAAVPPRNAFDGNDIPVPIVSGTPLPAMLNSPDTHCGDQRRCSDAEFDSVISDLQTQWAITPEPIRFPCVANSTLPSMERCILKRTESWLAENPNRQAPWVNPKNVGAIAREAK